MLIAIQRIETVQEEKFTAFETKNNNIEKLEI